MKLIAFFLLLNLLAIDQPSVRCNWTPSAASFMMFQLVPDLIDNPPPTAAMIIFPSGARVNLGAQLTPRQVRKRPRHLTYMTEEDTLYTLIMADPDVTRPNGVKLTFLHWLMVNIPGTNLSAGDTYSEFIPSGPPLGSGLHRYTLLIYKQPGRLQLKRPRVCNFSSEGRLGFNVTLFTAEYNLCNPVAGNFYLAQYDDSVPSVERQRNGIVPPNDIQLQYTTFIKCNISLPTF